MLTAPANACCFCDSRKHHRTANVTELQQVSVRSDSRSTCFPIVSTVKNATYAVPNATVSMKLKAHIPYRTGPGVSFRRLNFHVFSSFAAAKTHSVSFLTV
jgi:hypothetical protein